VRLPTAAIGILKEATRHVLRRPVVGICAFARAHDERILLVRRRDTMDWALPGGTLEWGETLETCLRRELLEEAGVELLRPGALLGVYSHPDRDFRFHAVTVVVGAKVSAPFQPPKNPLEIADVGLFEREHLPEALSHQMGDMISSALHGKVVWE
jgi:8-oxo-dGTP diphosphatase